MGTLSALDRLRQIEYTPRALRDMDDPPVIVLRRFTVGEKVQHVRDGARLATKGAADGGELAGAALSLVDDSMSKEERAQAARDLAVEISRREWDLLIEKTTEAQELNDRTLRAHVVEVRDLDGWEDEYESALDALLDLPPIVDELMAVLQGRSVIDSEGDEGK